MRFLRGDSKHKFAADSELSDAYAVNLRVLQAKVVVPPSLVSNLKLLPYVTVSGPHRTFLKEEKNLDYIPSGRDARKKNAPNTIFVRAMYLKKSTLANEDQKLLDQGMQLHCPYGIIIFLMDSSACEQASSKATSKDSGKHKIPHECHINNYSE